ncbi:hypothetical protein RSAG8_13411, partial [Rhizoctonia solani AG-8 WAC10335]
MLKVLPELDEKNSPIQASDELTVEIKPLNGPDPKDLPFEDPPDDDHGSEIGFDEENDWWDQASNADTDGSVVNNYDNQPIPENEEHEMCTELNKIVDKSFQGHGKTWWPTLDELMLSCICLMPMTLHLCLIEKLELIKASKLAAEFLRTKVLPTHLYGKANDLVIEDKELADAVEAHLHKIGKYMKVQDILGLFDPPEAQKFTHLINKPPTLCTAQNWMHKLGY